MGTKINRESLKNLRDEMEKRDISTNIILNLLKIDNLSNLSMDQYNYLLFLIKS